MQHFRKIAEGIEVGPLLAEIDAHPELWNLHPERMGSNSPHRETSDMWLRYADPKEIGEPGFFQRPHKSVWYPAIDVLPSLLPTVFDMMCEPFQEWGGVLMTRIGPGKAVYPHHDQGTWHSEHFNYKLWMVLRSNDRCRNHCEDETVTMEPGQVYSFDNLKMHAVENDGETDRIALIVCLRSAI